MKFTREVPELPSFWQTAIQDKLCETSDCPESLCKGCMFDAPLPEFREWLAQVLNEKETK